MSSSRGYNIKSRKVSYGPPANISRQPTEKELESLLDGYIKVPREKWKYVKYGDQIHYFDEDGEYKWPGGYVVRNYKSGSSYMLKLRDFPVGNFKEWTVDHSEISALFVRASTVELILKDEHERLVTAVKELSSSLCTRIKKLHKKIRKLADSMR